MDVLTLSIIYGYLIASCYCAGNGNCHQIRHNYDRETASMRRNQLIIQHGAEDNVYELIDKDRPFDRACKTYYVIIQH